MIYVLLFIMNRIYNLEFTYFIYLFYFIDKYIVMFYNIFSITQQFIYCFIYKLHYINILFTSYLIHKKVFLKRIKKRHILTLN